MPSERDRELADQAWATALTPFLFETYLATARAEGRAEVVAKVRYVIGDDSDYIQGTWYVDKRKLLALLDEIEKEDKDG